VLTDRRLTDQHLATKPNTVINADQIPLGGQTVCPPTRGLMRRM